MRFVFISIVIVLVVSGCGGAKPTPATGGSTGNGVHILIDLKGSPAIKRQGWSAYAPAFFGMALHSGDLLRLDSAAVATIACADLTLARATGGINSVPCKVSKPILVYGDSLLVATRADTPANIPQVISPRKTKVLAARPMLRWTAVSETSAYTVSVRGPNLNWTATVTGKTELVYPDSAPTLAAGAAYKLTVAAGSHSSDEEQGAGLGFTMLKAEEAQVVRDGETRIRGLGLADAGTRLLTANLYAGQGLIAEAIDQLEALSATAQEPAVMRTLGDLYLKIGLNRQAEQRYLQALALSQKVDDTEGQAAAESALGLVYDALGNQAEANQHAQKAIQWYQTLGDSQSIKLIQERLQKP